MSHMTNPLATPEQLYQRRSIGSLPTELQDVIFFATQCLTQAAGLLLQLPQSTTAQANVILARYWLVEPMMTHEFSVRPPPPSPFLPPTNPPPGRLRRGPLPHHQSRPLPRHPTRHRPRLHLPPLALLLLPPPALLPATPQRPTILPPLRRRLPVLPHAPPRPRGPPPLRPRLRHPRRPPPPARHHLPAGARLPRPAQGDGRAPRRRVPQHGAAVAADAVSDESAECAGRCGGV